MDDVQAADEDKGSAPGTQSKVIDVESVFVVPNVDEKARSTIVEIESEIIEEEINVAPRSKFSR